MDRIDDVDCLLARYSCLVFGLLPAPPERRFDCQVEHYPKQIDTESTHLNKFVYSFPAPDVFPFIFIVAAPSGCGNCFFGRFTEHHLLGAASAAGALPFFNDGVYCFSIWFPFLSFLRHSGSVCG